MEVNAATVTPTPGGPENDFDQPDHSDYQAIIGQIQLSGPISPQKQEMMDDPSPILFTGR